MAHSFTLFAAACVLLAGLCSGFSLDDHVKNHVRLHFYTSATASSQKGIQIPKELSMEDILSTGYNPILPTKILIHGFSNSVTSDSMQILKNAYFSVSDKQNVIICDWSDLDPAPLYLAGLYYVNGVGVRMGEVIDFMVAEGLLDLNNLHIIGHSLGAHVAAVTAENVQSGTVKRVTGLDPARPFVDMTKESGRLSAGDAKLVDVIHTNGGTLGSQTACGDVDFYPNGGKSQPGCFLDFFGTCSHGRSFELFAESIENPVAFNDAIRCGDEWDAIHKRCVQDESLNKAVMGDKVEFPAPGAYYLETASNSPYCLRK